MSITNSQPVAPKPPRRWFTGRTLLLMSPVIIFLLLPVVNMIRGPQVQLCDAIATADRIVVRDGGFDCCGSVDDDAILFEITDPREIKTVLANLESTTTQSSCKCCGFPGIDWYEGKRRLALTAIQHGEAIRYGDSDWRLSETSRAWIVRWLVEHGVNETEIQAGCGGPRKGLRQEAVKMQLAQTCVARGQAHAAQGDLDAAIVDFSEAVEHEGNFAPAHYFRGLAYEKSGNLENAIKDFTEAIWFNDQSQRDNRAEVAKYLADPGEPFGLEGTIAVLQARGRAYEQIGDKTKAEADFAQARKLGYTEKKN